jgi:hypothetical protein
MKTLVELPYGTTIKYRNKLYTVICGVEGKIIVHAETGNWDFAKDLKWRKFSIVYNPNGKSD